MGLLKKNGAITPTGRNVAQTMPDEWRLAKEYAEGRAS